jgi:hypothetical protein
MNGNEVSVAVAAGFFVPFVVSFLKDKNWATSTKELLAMVVVFITSALITVFDNGAEINNVDSFVANFGVIFSTAQIWYRRYFENTQLNGVIENSGVGS